MSRTKILYIVIIIAVLASIFTYISVFADVKVSETVYQLEHAIVDAENLEKIYENENFIFYFRDSRDVLSIYDKRNDYTWKSGIDIPAAKDVKAALRNDEPLGTEPLEVKMNEIFTDIANSLFTLEYYDSSNNIKRLPSSGEGTVSNFMSVQGEDNHFVLNVTFSDIDMQVKAHVLLTDAGYDIQIFNNEITGTDKDILAAIILNPFMGASGGRYQLYDEEIGKHGDKIDKPKIPGYVFVPDGSGALIEFNDYNVSLNSYESKVYGNNPAKITYNYMFNNDSFVPFKQQYIPVYGIAHGERQNAFVGYAQSGDTHMEIIVVPEENTTHYTWAYPRFVYNSIYYQIFNKQGEGYFTLFEQPDEFDINFSYEFLAGAGDTGYPADYSGMALVYRDHLIDAGILSEVAMQSSQIPIRLDFIMSDQKKSVIGFENSVTTTAHQVQEVVDDLLYDNNYNINIGLYGWQDGGITSGVPYKANYTGEIGTKNDFDSLIQSLTQSGIDVSFATDYVKIHGDQVRMMNNAVKHYNKWYVGEDLWTDVPITDFNYARPEKSAQWLVDQINKLKRLDIQSHTVEGMSSLLITDHGNDPLTEQEVIALYQETFEGIANDITLNLKTPNQYLWSYTDRFLQAPVYHTQFLIETEAVPFLQMVLNGTMEVYGPYANFSFSSQEDILHMIDYNVYPTFVLTKEASYLLSTTNSQNLYSTEFSEYKDVINDVYTQVNEALGAVMNQTWTDRIMIASGVVKNTYSGGTEIIINYTEDDYYEDGLLIEAMSFIVVK